MAKIKVTSKCELYDGMSITFKAPCDSAAVDGLNVYYNGVGQSYSFRDAHGNDLASFENLFCTGAYVKVILNTGEALAYLQNADTNAYLEGRLGGTFLASAVIVSDETAAVLSLDSGATVDEALQIMADSCAGLGITQITVLTEDGEPISGVTLTGLLSVDSTAVSTDINGIANVVCHADTAVTFDSPYYDIPPYVETIHPKSDVVNYVTVVMPYLTTTAVLYSESVNKSFWRSNAVDVCCVGAGGGGGGLYFYQYYNNMSGGHSGRSYGGGGGAVNTSYSLTPTVGTAYSMVIGAGGSRGTTTSGYTDGSAGGTTSFMGVSAVGGNGGGGIYHYSSNNVGSVSSYGTSAAAVTNGCASGATATVYPFGDNSYPASGGGGAGMPSDTTTASKCNPYGGHNPCGGGGGWAWRISSAGTTYNAPVEDGIVPGGGGGGYHFSNGYYSSSYSGYGGNGAAGGVYIRAAQ